MHVIKRDGRMEPVQFDKITARLKKLVYGLDEKYIDVVAITQKVITGVYDKVTTIELDELAAQTAAYCATQHPEYSLLAARIAVSNLHKMTKKQFSSVIKDLYLHEFQGQHTPLIAKDIYEIVQEHAELLDSSIIYDRDFDYDYFGFKTLERAYLMKLNGKVAERPQHMLMRVAVGIHREDITSVLETYNMMSQRLFTHASPTLFNAGTPTPQLSSCFLLCMKEDSIIGIYDTLSRCASISKHAGGIGISAHNVRARDSYIGGTNGSSNGLVPMLRVFNNAARHVTQGGGKRKGSFAIYLEPWHADIFEFLELRKNHGDELQRARDLFYALWVPDLFMKRVQENGQWSLFCPNEARGLQDVYGEEFETLYEKYEKEGKARKSIPAQQLWFAILDAQVETGTPYMLYKDHCNKKSNQKNLGTIKSSNLCTEILEYTSPDEVAVCNLASINLSAFVNEETPEPTLNFDHLVQVTKVVTKNLNVVIDGNYYPIPEARNSNMRHRPIGIGVQGLADCFIRMRLPFESSEARKLNQDIFEAIYYGAVEASMELAIKDGPYSTWEGSPISKGQFQFDLWNFKPSSGRFDWDNLRSKCMKHGVRNSLLLAPMPTASTAQILGNNESVEPFTSNMYSRRVLAGEFAVVNKYLLKDLIKRGLWTAETRNQLMKDRGSVQNIASVPKDLKDLYKTVWEIKQKTILDMAAERGVYICQSQSLNIHLSSPTTSQLTSMHFHAWKLGLKTGLYYLRTRPKADAIQFTVEQNMPTKTATSNDQEEKNGKINSASTGKENQADPEEEEICLSCGA